MKVLIVAACALGLVGCASTDYKHYADSQSAQAVARAQADVARYAALAKIADSGDAAARVAAAMALAIQGQPAAPQTAMAAPKAWDEKLLGWAAVLMPSLTQIYATNRQAAVGIAQSENAAQVGISTNNTMAAIAGRIQGNSAVTNNTTTNTTNNTGSFNDSTAKPTVVAPNTLLVQ